MKEPKEQCIHLTDGSCECNLCEDVLDDDTPILTPRCTYPYERTIWKDEAPVAADFEDECPYYMPPKQL